MEAVSSSETRLVPLYQDKYLRFFIKWEFNLRHCELWGCEQQYSSTSIQLVEWHCIPLGNQKLIEKLDIRISFNHLETGSFEAIKNVYFCSLIIKFEFFSTNYNQLHGTEVLSAKLTDPPASQGIPSILWNPKVYYRIHRRPTPGPILIQINPLQSSGDQF
jgi:hypothetical protein